MTKEQFAKSDEFLEAVVASTKAGFGGSGYSTEFFQDGRHRTIWDGHIGNLYRSPGEIIPIPQLSAEQVFEADDQSDKSLIETARFYQDELAELFLSS